MRATLRPGTPADSPAVFDVFVAAILDLSRRVGSSVLAGGQDPASLQRLWEWRRPLLEHLAATADRFWIAEADGKVVGYARSILRDGLRQLSEFFVLPERQSAGIGGALLARTFPAEHAIRRVVVGTTDWRAIASYLKAGVLPRFPSVHFMRPAEPVAFATDLAVEPMAESVETLQQLAAIDAVLIGHRRDVDHRRLLAHRQGFLFRRAGRAVAYGYVGEPYLGPFAALAEADMAALLSHAETLVAGRGGGFGVEVPLVNRAAVEHLLQRGCHMEQFLALFISDKPFGRFENYVFTSPPYFL